MPDDRWLIAPEITWAPSDRTTLTLLADYQHDETGWSQFLPSQGTFAPLFTAGAETRGAEHQPLLGRHHRHGE